MPIIKSTPLPKSEFCTCSEHLPPMHQVFQPGIYEWLCPSCGHITEFSVPSITCKN